MERESSKECSVSFLWTNDIVFRGIQPCFLHGGSERLAGFEPTRQRGFWRHLRYIPSSMIKETYVFKRDFFVFIKVSWTFSTFWHRHERKTTKCAFEIVFSPYVRPIYLAWTQRFNLYHANCFLGLTYWFLNKNFQEIKLFTCHCSFITLAQKTIT